MVTLRTYWNRDRAVLAKALLENYGVSCSLIHENANNLYPFAMPIRLLVAEDQADRAVRILSDDIEHAEEMETSDESGEVSVEPSAVDEIDNRNPWELLALAFCLLVPAACLITTRFPTDVTGGWARYYVARATVTQFLSWLAVFSLCFWLSPIFE